MTVIEGTHARSPTAAHGFISPDVVRAMNLDLFFDYLGARRPRADTLSSTGYSPTSASGTC